MTPLKCVANHTGERVDQFLARTVPGGRGGDSGRGTGEEKPEDRGGGGL